MWDTSRRLEFYAPQQEVVLVNCNENNGVTLNLVVSVLMDRCCIRQVSDLMSVNGRMRVEVLLPAGLIVMPSRNHDEQASFWCVSYVGALLCKCIMHVNPLTLCT